MEFKKMIKEIGIINKEGDAYAVSEGTTKEIIKDLENLFGDME